jgi:UDP-N-acetylglucosamine:LPS N-acetylglucosamine transferase
VTVLWHALVALVRALRLIGRYRPRVVVGVGGYASLPTVVAARLRRVPVVVHEQNGFPGLANRVAVRLGAAAAVSLPDTPLRGAVLVGNPVRAAVRAAGGADRAASRRPVLAVVGGSLGARTLNDAALGLYDRWRARADVSVRHVTGPRNYNECERALAAARRAGDVLDYTLVPYEDDMAALYATTSVLVSRAGASATAELAIAGVPAILVPLPGAPGDHQTANARAFAAAGAAVMVPDAELTAERLDREAGALLVDTGRLDGMRRAARGLARPDAADRLAELVDAAARA